MRVTAELLVPEWLFCEVRPGAVRARSHGATAIKARLRLTERATG
jgi:hypothetical protein